MEQKKRRLLKLNFMFFVISYNYQGIFGMKSKKIGRNEPCPCGSGKKYKKCCYGKTLSDKNNKLQNINQIFPTYHKIDFGMPILDESFFRMNTVHEISAPRLLYSSLLNPEAEKLASVITNQFLDRGIEESELIEDTDDVKKLIDMIIEGIDSLNHEKMKNKLLQHKESSIPLIINELKKPTSSQFVEIAVKIIHASGIDYSRQIFEIIENNQITPYAVSLLCMLLGFYENKKSEKILWDYYHYFNEHFHNETYSDGPLLGLIEMRERKREELSKNQNITMG